MNLTSTASWGTKLIALVFSFHLSTQFHAQCVYLLNGDFESPQTSGILVTSDLVIPGFAWHLPDGAQIDIIRGYWPASSGSQSIDLNGWVRGGIYQDFNFESSGLWKVRFDMAPNPDSATDKTLRVNLGMAGGDLVDMGTFSLPVGTRTRSDMQWVTLETQPFFVDDLSALYRLSFTSLIEGASGPALDNVRIVPVPEPSISCFSMLLLAFAGVSSKIRRRQP
jgi:hypothetical protein